mgnify:CR=1 FL=1
MSSAIVQSAAPEIPPATQNVPSQPHKTPTKPSLRYATPPSPPSSGPSSPPRLDEISHDDPWSDSILPAPLPAQTAELVIELTPIWKDANQGHGGMNASTLEGSWRSHGAQRVPGDEGPSGSERAEVVFDAAKREVASIASLGVYDPKRESSSSASRLVLPVPVAPVRKVHGPMPTAVWADIMDTSKGRDKVLVRETSPIHPCPMRCVINPGTEMRPILPPNIPLPPLPRRRCQTPLAVVQSQSEETENGSIRLVAHPVR